MNIPLSAYAVKTERGESRSKRGISARFHKFGTANRTVADIRATRKAQESRRLQNRANRAAWSNDSNPKDGFPLPVAIA